MYSILSAERQYYLLAIIYGVGISLLSLATPISVQMLVNTVANTGLKTPLIVLSITLFLLLIFASLVVALRIHLMDMFSRRFYARMVSEIALRTIYAVDPYFDNAGKTALFNRYFDIIIVQKMLPTIIVGGFTVILQAIVGFVVVSLYHPYFLIFNISILLLLWLVWVLWGRRAVLSAVQLSHNKHATAAWLEEIGSSDGFYRSEYQIESALKKTDSFTANYIEEHIKHFRQYFSQTLCFLFIYASGSAILLGLGGWLVMQGQLNLGQLVAAELVLSVVFYGISQFGTYLVYFYDLCGAIDELNNFLLIEYEDSPVATSRIEGDASLKFVNASGSFAKNKLTLNFEVPSKARVLVSDKQYNVKQLLTTFLQGQQVPQSGFFMIGGVEARSLPLVSLRKEIRVIIQPRTVSVTIREYLDLQSDATQKENLLDVIAITGLESVISQLEHGIDTRITESGWPLSVSEIAQLKLASAILAKPRVLVLGEMFDIVQETILINAFEKMRTESSTSILHFSNHHWDLGYTHELQLDADRQILTSLDSRPSSGSTS
ncbi:MAG: ABC transporter ATP-binding protein [Gammaproteobacteria bacterium]|nr:ABC transporter ATP-binding protein [Gammaproteobacteria bacterium]